MTDRRVWFPAEPVRLLLAVGALFIALAAWAFASPVGASPDEDHHLVSIWCAGGDFTDRCESTATAMTRLVSPGLLDAACYAHHPEIAATCQTREGVFESTELVETDRGNFFGGYPGGFFRVMRLFATPDIQASVITMRLVNALLFCGVLAGLVLVQRTQLSRLMLTGAAIAVVPLGLFTIASINPSSWAFTAIFATFFGTCEAFASTGRRRLVLGGIAVLGLALAAAARYDAFIYAVLSVLVAAALSTSWRPNRRTVAIVLGAGAAAVLLFVSLDGFAIIQSLMYSAGTSGHQDASPIAVFFYNVAMLPELFAGFSGENGLGWLDTSMPFSTWLVAALVLWGVLFSQLRGISKSALTLAGLMSGLLVFVPITVLQVSNATVGQNVQARYLYPMLLILVFVLLAGVPGFESRLTLIQSSLVIAGLALSQALAIFFNMSRYISGGEYPTKADLNTAAASGWWWSAGPTPMVVLGAAVVGFTGFLLLALLHPRAPREISPV